MALKRELPQQSAEMDAPTELVQMVKEQRLALAGSKGLLEKLNETVTETALSEEMTEHLSYVKKSIQLAVSPATLVTAFKGSRPLIALKNRPASPADRCSLPPGPLAQAHWFQGPEWLRLDVLRHIHPIAKCPTI